jgi:hypothetical protein
MFESAGRFAPTPRKTQHSFGTMVALEAHSNPFPRHQVMKMTTAVIALLFFMFLSILSSQGQDNKEPTWQETADFVARILEHYGKFLILHPGDAGVSNVTINDKNLSYEISAYDQDASGRKNKWIRIISFPLDKLDIGTIKASKSEDLSKLWESSVFRLQFYCLAGKCIQYTMLHRVLADNGQWGDPEKMGEFELDNSEITSTDEDAMNRLARALKHLAILAGSPSKDLFSH